MFLLPVACRASKGKIVQLLTSSFKAGTQFSTSASMDPERLVWVDLEVNQTLSEVRQMYCNASVLYE